MTTEELIQIAVADESHLRQALKHGDVAPLLMVLVHLSGDAQWLERLAPHINGPWPYNEDAPPEVKDAIIEALIEALNKYATEHLAIPTSPPLELLPKMLSTCVGQKSFPSEYLPLVLEELNFHAQDAKTITWRRSISAEEKRNFQVLIIGAGFSGLAMAVKLREAGISFQVIEKNSSVGGTWYENTYPGCGVDTPNHFYSYSFRLNPDWEYFFARREEIFSYILECTKEFELDKWIQLGEEVQASVWNAATSCWDVTVRKSDGSSGMYHANVVVSAAGLLNRPNYPPIPGLNSFKGPMFHTARWDHSVDYHGKSVAMIGTGASGMQVGPTIAPTVQKLTIFQRSPHWAVRNPLYFNKVDEPLKWVMKYIPFYAKWFRFQLFYASSEVFHSSLTIDPSWPHPQQSLNAANQAMRELLVKHISTELGNDADLMKKSIPDYPPFGKRMLRDNHWYRTLTRSNVELVTERIVKVTPTGIETSDGKAHAADVIVLATGFQAGRMLGPLSIIGRDGANLQEMWKNDNPRAYLGITMPKFPNFFVLYGPNTNLAHGGSAIFHSECQVRYVMQGIRELLEMDAASMECRELPFEEYNKRVDQVHSTMVWSHKGVGNWYKNKAGRVFANSPWRLVDYRDMTAELDPADFKFTYRVANKTVALEQ